MHTKDCFVIIIIIITIIIIIIIIITITFIIATNTIITIGLFRNIKCLEISLNNR